MVLIQKKDFAKALLFWLFFGGFGAHRIYIQEKMHVLIWYWAANVCTLGILAIVDAFLIKGMIEKKYEEDRMKEEYRKTSSMPEYSQYREERERINDEEYNG